MARRARQILVPLAVLLSLTAVAVQPAATMAAPEPPPLGCPEGWEEVRPPVNWVIQCLPTDLAVEGSTDRTVPPPFLAVTLGGECPEGWAEVRHPVNPALRCLPTDIAAPEE